MKGASAGASARRTLRLASLAIGLAIVLSACGGGDDGASAPAPAAPYAWIDSGGIQAFGAAKTVEMGFDGATAYVRRDSYTHTHPGSARFDLSYIGDSGAPQLGQDTQWVRFAMRGERYFETQAEHLPIILRFAQYPDPRTAQQSPRSVGGKMVFFGRDGLRAWDCATPDAVGVYFETRVAARTEAPDISAVKCAQDNPGVLDGVWYRVEMSASAGRIAYSITDESGRTVSAAATDDRDYPASESNAAFLRDVVSDSPGAPWATRYAALNANQGFAFLSAFNNNRSPWSLRFSDVASGWR